MEHNQADKKTRWANSYMITPPDNALDSFSQDLDDALEVKGWQEAIRNTLAPIQAHTPPASPETQVLPSLSSATGLTPHDAPLFPEYDGRSRVRSQSPLFRGSSPLRDDRAGRSVHVARPRTALSPWSSVRTPQDARRYHSDRIAELRHLREIQLPTPQMSAASCNLDKESKRQLHSLSKSGIANKVTKLRASATIAKPLPKPKVPNATSAFATPTTKVTTPRRRTPKAKTYDEFVESAFPPSQQHNKHKRAPPTKKVEGVKVSWTELPDYAPPTSTLDSPNVKPLKASWPGSALNLNDDPDRAHLHPQELALASTLRLTCASYLTNKRKIFQARLKSLQDGKSFTKTAAQTACSIDVNKASGLWEAFDKAGWFESRFFDQYL